jgi:RNA polymerase sigma-70 factor (ECF subfamily)
MSPAEREACILDALGILPALACRTGVASIRHPVADREDYLQVGAAAIVEAADRYEPHRGTAFTTYAWRAARDAMLAEARRLRWRRQAAPRPGRQIVSLEAVLDPEDRGDDLGEHAAATEDQVVLLAAVAALPPGQRDAVRLHYFADLDQAETARRLGITQSAVSLRLTAARAALAVALTTERLAS